MAVALHFGCEGGFSPHMLSPQHGRRDDHDYSRENTAKKSKESSDIFPCFSEPEIDSGEEGTRKELLSMSVDKDSGFRDCQEQGAAQQSVEILSPLLESDKNIGGGEQLLHLTPLPSILSTKGSFHKRNDSPSEADTDVPEKRRVTWPDAKGEPLTNVKEFEASDSDSDYDDDSDSEGGQACSCVVQ